MGLSPLAPAAFAAGETLAVVLTQLTGTAPFDTVGGAGFDTSPADLKVRTNDTLNYGVEISVNGGNATNVTFDIDLPKGTALDQVPVYCQTGSGLTPTTVPFSVAPFTVSTWTSLPTQHLTCNVGARTNGSTLTYPVAAKVRGEVPDGSNLGSAGSPVTVRAKSDGAPTQVISNGVAATVTARSQADLTKNQWASENGGYIDASQADTPCPGNLAIVCRRLVYPINVSVPSGGRGNTPLQNSVTFVDDVSPGSYFPNAIGLPASPTAAWMNDYGARLGSCSTAIMFQNPNPKITGGSVTAANSVRDTGTISCSQPGGPGTPITVTFTGADTTASTYPSVAAHPVGYALPSDRAVVLTGQIAILTPYNAVRDFGVGTPGNKDLTLHNKFTNFAPLGIDGVPNLSSSDLTWNNYRSVNLAYKPSGSFDKTFVGYPNLLGNTPPASFSPGWSVWEGPSGASALRSGDGTVLDGQPIISGLRFSNTSTATQQTMLSYACDGFDPNSLRLFDGPHPASSTAQMQSIASAGSPVWMSGFTMTPSPSLLKVEYGTGAVTNKSQARCDDADSPTGWTTDPADPIHGNDLGLLTTTKTFSAISKVRIRIELPVGKSAPQYATVSIAQKIVGRDPVTGLPNADRTVIPNFASVKRAFDKTWAQIVDPSLPWSMSTYSPGSAVSPPTGNLGDRILLGQALGRILKQVKNPATGVWANAHTPAVAAGSTVDYRLVPSVTASVVTPNQVPVRVEDCLDQGLSFEVGSDSPPASIVLVGSNPLDADLSCSAGQTYVRWNLGPLTINALIPPIAYKARTTFAVPSGTVLRNTAAILASGDASTITQRSSKTQVQVVSPSGIRLEKTPITPLNEASFDTFQHPNIWDVRIANLNTAGVSGIDIVDLLPTNTEMGSHFSGTYEFVSAIPSAANPAPNTDTILYTKTARADLRDDPVDPTNLVTGATIWCDAPLNGVVVSGAGTASDCPSSPAQVSALRFRRSGLFELDSQRVYRVTLQPTNNRSGDVYVNRASARAGGLALLVGPVDGPERIVESSIGHGVWEDLNGNGIRESSEPGLGGVNVQLYAAEGVTEIPVGADGMLRSSDDGPGGLTSDTDGNYKISGLHSGHYQVRFSTPVGWVNTKPQMGSNDVVDSDVSIVSGFTDVLTVGAGSNLSTIDAGYYRPASLSGHVYVDPNGDASHAGTGDIPLNSIAITLNGIDGTGNPVNLSTFTDATGYYEFTNLPPSGPSGYTINETQPDGFPDSADIAGSGTTNPGTAANDVLSGIVVQSNEAGINYDFTELSSVVQPPPTPAMLSGRVYIHGTNTGISGVLINLDGVDQLSVPVHLSVLTGLDGTYRFQSIPIGTYVLTETQPLNYLDNADTLGTGISTPGTLTNDSVSGIVLRSNDVASGYDFSETVELVVPPLLAALSGSVTDENGNPIANVSVNLTGTDIDGNPVTLVATTSASGRYGFDQVAASDPSGYTIRETQPVAFDDGSVQPGSTGGSAGTNSIIGIVLAPGAVSTGNNFIEIKPKVVVISDPPVSEPPTVEPPTSGRPNLTPPDFPPLTPPPVTVPVPLAAPGTPYSLTTEDIVPPNTETVAADPASPSSGPQLGTTTDAIPSMAEMAANERILGSQLSKQPNELAFTGGRSQHMSFDACGLIVAGLALLIIGRRKEKTRDRLCGIAPT
jgi:SdrD B-like domain